MPNVLEPDNESNKPSIIQDSTSLSDLSMERQFTHRMFLNQIDTIDLNSAKELLGQLHLLYLCQMQTVTKIAKKEFLGE